MHIITIEGNHDDFSSEIKSVQMDSIVAELNNIHITEFCTALSAAFTEHLKYSNSVYDDSDVYHDFIDEDLTTSKDLLIYLLESELKIPHGINPYVKEMIERILPRKDGNYIYKVKRMVLIPLNDSTTYYSENL